MGPLRGHTAGWNNSHSTGQTVSQNNFIVPKIGLECTAEMGRGRAVEGGQWEGKEKEGHGAKKKGWVGGGGCGKLRRESWRKCSLGGGQTV